MENNLARERLTQARVALILQFPDWGAAAYTPHYRADNTVPTAATDGVDIHYHPEFICSITHEECVGVLAHELLHCALLHVPRRGARDRGRWNIACDQLVNAICEWAGLQLPAGHIPAGPLDKTVEELYDALPPRAALAPEWCDLLDAAADGAATDLTEDSAATWRYHALTMAGSLPGAIAQQLRAALAPPVDWRILLAAYISCSVPSDERSWSRPHRRHPGLHPGKRREPALRLGVAVDTSGSIDPETVGRQFLSYIDQLVATYAGSRIGYLADAAVTVRVGADDPWPDTWEGGGGTDFGTAIAAAAADGVDVLVYLTDGEGTFPPQSEIPIVWALTHPTPVPFGQTILLPKAGS